MAAAMVVRAQVEVDHGAEGDTFDEIVGRSAALKQVLAQAVIVTPTDATALILGETGTGKELIARAIHRWSLRKDRPFITLNCELPAGVRKSEAATLCDPVMPVADGLSG